MVFEYTGLNQAGKEVRGLREADNAKGLRSLMRKEGIFLTQLSGREETAEQKRSVDFKNVVIGRVSGDDIAIMTRQLATLIGAGIPLVEALTALVEQIEHEKLKRIVGEIKQRVNEGSSLADAMAQHPAVFTPIFVNMVRAGESSGALDVVLIRLADFTEGQARLRSKVLGTLAYPAFMLVFSGLIMGILFTVVIPKVTQIFADINATLPMMTRMLIFVSEVFKNWWYLILLGLIGAVFGARSWLRTKTGKAAFDTWLLRLPIFGPLARMLAVSRFAKTLGTLLKSGVPLLTALDIVKNIVDNTVLVKVIEEAREAIREGESIAAPLKRSGEFPPLVYHMIAVGERSGQLEDMLGNIAQAYDSQIETRIGSMTSMLEPIMIVVMGGGVAFVVFSILIPILQMNTFVRG